jgi:hypothetical protein
MKKEKREERPRKDIPWLSRSAEEALYTLIREFLLSEIVSPAAAPRGSDRIKQEAREHAFGQKEKEKKKKIQSFVVFTLWATKTESAQNERGSF